MSLKLDPKSKKEVNVLESFLPASSGRPRWDQLSRTRVHDDNRDHVLCDMRGLGAAILQEIADHQWIFKSKPALGSARGPGDELNHLFPGSNTRTIL